MTGTSDADTKKNFPMAMAWILVASLVTAYVLAHFMVYTQSATGTTGVTNGLQTALWAGLGLCVTTVITSTAMENRDYKYMAIVAGNRLVTLLVMGLILGLFMK